MTLDGFLTVLALAAAFYAVLSPVQRLRVSLTWRRQLLIAVPAFFSIVIFELFDLQPPPCPTGFGKSCQFLILSGSDSEQTHKFSFIIAISWLTMAIIIHGFSKPSFSNITAYTQIAINQITEEQYGDALKLIEPHVSLFARASLRKYWHQRIHDWLENYGPTAKYSLNRYLNRHYNRRYSGENWPDWAAKPVRALAHVVPAGARGEHAASELFQFIMNSPLLLEYIVSRRPYFGLTLFREKISGGPDFFERYMAELIRRPGSALYQEISTNDMSDGLIGYRLPERNRLLHFLFSDVHAAEYFSAWKPVGDYVMRLLDGDQRPDYWTWLNGRPDWFERDQMRDPTYISMFYFDIMVTSAAKQGILNHMWLYYFSSFAKNLEKNYDSSDKAVDQSAEFPTRAARLLYELVQYMTSWVEIFRHLPEGATHRVFPQPFDGAATVPHAAAQALGNTLFTIVMSSNIDRGVIQTLHDVTIRSIKKFHKEDAELSKMRAYLIRALLHGGHGAANRLYRERLSDLIIIKDHIFQCEVEDYIDALKAPPDED